MRLPSVRRQPWPAVVGGGLATFGVALAVTVATSGCGHQAVGGALSAQGPSSASASAPAAGAAPAGTRSGGGRRARPPRGATPTGADPSGGSPSTGTQSTGGGLAGTTPTRLVVPDVIASVPGGLTTADLAKIRKLGGVRTALAIDGAQIAVNGTRLTVLAAPAAALRPWTPPATAASAPVWSAFQGGRLVTTAGAAAKAHLAAGQRYLADAAVRTQVTDGGTALLGVAGVDGVVSQAEGARLGLVKSVAVLVNAPAVNPDTLAAEVQSALGPGARVVRLVAAAQPASLPVDASPPAGRPTSYLQLFQASAARYCPGLSWTVLAAIGQIESADGQNVGPSTAGALGPMQFLPSTWSTWGIDGFGDTGAPDIMNPFDAVPSAARMLCAEGATTGAPGLRQAIFGYNHADWYVNEVLTLATEYAREYPS